MKFSQVKETKVRIILYKCEDPNCEECDFDSSSMRALCSKCEGKWRLNPEQTCESVDPAVASASNAILGASVSTIALSALKGPDMFASFNFI